MLSFKIFSVGIVSFLKHKLLSSVFPNSAVELLKCRTFYMKLVSAV